MVFVSSDYRDWNYSIFLTVAPGSGTFQFFQMRRLHNSVVSYSSQIFLPFLLIVFIIILISIIYISSQMYSLNLQFIPYFTTALTKQFLPHASSCVLTLMTSTWIHSVRKFPKENEIQEDISWWKDKFDFRNFWMVFKDHILIKEEEENDFHSISTADKNSVCCVTKEIHQ